MPDNNLGGVRGSAKAWGVAGGGQKGFHCSRRGHGVGTVVQDTRIPLVVWFGPI